MNESGKSKIWDILKEIPDPEVPVLTVTDLGIIRNVILENKEVTVTITPTYSGCPAMTYFEDEITSRLKSEGYEKVTIKITYKPPWTTDWLTDEAREKLRKYGIAPPVGLTSDKGFLTDSGPKTVPCPQCKSFRTSLISQFGSTACKALYKCEDCLEPFDYFKCI